MAMRIAVAEDEDAQREQLVRFISRYAKDHQLQIDVQTFRDGVGLTTDYKGGYDIIFLDIQMPLQDGLTTAQIIRRYDQNVVLVFITNMAQYAIKGYSVNAFNFILKPIQYPSFYTELDAAVAKALASRQHHDSVLLRTPEGHRQVRHDSIIYVEHIKRVLHVHTRDDILEVRMPIRDLETLLDDSRFFCPHSGYLVNLYHVERVGRETLTVSGSELPLSRHRRDALLEAMTLLMKSRMS